MAARFNSGDLCRGQPRVIARSEVLSGISYIDEMVRHPAHFRACQFCGCNVETTIDLNRVEVEYLTAEPQRQPKAKRALARRSRADNSNNWWASSCRFHHQA